MRSPDQSSTPGQYRERVRQGFWNKRGDHVTPEGYVVYAPDNKAYPMELRDYPGSFEGWRDHLGNFLAHQPRPELPDSLPKHGMAAVRPYESVSAQFLLFLFCSVSNILI
jgi:hypothetical protein